MKYFERGETMISYEGKEPFIFVSYAHRDATRVLPIITALSENGFRIWYDAGIEAGAEWPEYIAKHLEGAKTFIAFLSSNAVDSINCRQEINYAITLGKPTLFIHLDAIELSSGLKMRLGLSQAMFLYQYATLKSFLDELTKTQILSPCKKNELVNCEFDDTELYNFDDNFPEIEKEKLPYGEIELLGITLHSPD